MAGKPVTFRVRRIPPEQDVKSLADYLSSFIPALGGTLNITVRSLSNNPADHQLRPRKIATIEFTDVPLLFASGDQEWTFHLPDSHDFILLDKHFHGFTPLNNVRNDQVNYDIIALSGLAGHPFGSWRQRSRTSAKQFMWLRDQLPYDIPSVRVMIYGYDTSLIDTDSHQSIDDLARTFVQHLKLIGRAECSARPCVMLAHSLGGIIAKRALYYMAGSGDAEEFMLNRTRLIILFGVPNRGMKIASLMSMTKDQPNETLVHELSQNSSYLNFLDEVFGGIAIHHRLRVVSAYETKASATATNELGQWNRNGPREILVNRESAIQKVSRNPEDIFHIDQDHSSIVKFGPDDTSYLTTADFLRAFFDAPSHAVQDSVPTTTSAEKPTGKVDLQQPQTSDQIDQEDRWSRGFVSSKHIPSVQELQKSLRFPERTVRLDAITDSDVSSFGWLWKKDIGFMEWILTRPGVYWIQGKPGSGKSTLMKHLYKNDTLRRELRSSGKTDLWFFFNERGGYLQKSFDGLLRAILFELVSVQPMVAKLLGQVYRRVQEGSSKEWDISALQEAFSCVADQDQQKLDIVLFLDALDEYNGFPEAIAKWIQNLTQARPNSQSLTTIKLCFSSRPWSAFVQAFGNEPGFVLHHHTMQDIRKYAERRLLPMCRTSSKESHEFYWHQIPARKVIQTLVDLAEGVFLWVQLALDMLKDQKDCRSMQEFDTLVNEMPMTLESFYASTINRIALNNRREALVLLEVVLRSSTALNVFEVCLAAECAKGETYQQCEMLVDTRKKTLSSSADAQSYLFNLCAGLLECVPSKESELPYVQFIHLTVKEYVSSPEFLKAILDTQYDLHCENGFTYLFRYEMECRKTLSSRDARYSAASARADERTTGRPAYAFLQSVPESIFEGCLRARMKAYYNTKISPNSFSFAILNGLLLYVEAMISKHKSSNTNHDIFGNPLCTMAWDVLINFDSDYDESLDWNDRLKMWKTLLDAGFSPSERDENNLNPWDILVSVPLLSSATETFFSDRWNECRKGLEDLVEMLCEYSLTQASDLVHHILAPGESKFRPMGSIYLLLVACSEAKSSLAIKQPTTLNRIRTDKMLSALHFCNLSLCKVLLKYRADPNVLDVYGHTPLDLISFHRPLTSLQAQDFHDKAVLLISHRGHVTLEGAQSWTEYLQYLKDLGIQPSESLLICPLLPSMRNGEDLEEVHRSQRPSNSKDDEKWDRKFLKRKKS